MRALSRGALKRFPPLLYSKTTTTRSAVVQKKRLDLNPFSQSAGSGSGSGDKNVDVEIQLISNPVHEELEEFPYMSAAIDKKVSSRKLYEAGAQHYATGQSIYGKFNACDK